MAKKNSFIFWSGSFVTSPKCKTEMTLSDIVYPGIGSILELIHKREYEKMQEEVYEL